MAGASLFPAERRGKRLGPMTEAVETYPDGPGPAACLDIGSVHPG